MALLVQKFGGTSVGSIERIEAVADKVIGYKQAGNDMVVVLHGKQRLSKLRVLFLAGWCRQSNPDLPQNIA